MSLLHILFASITLLASWYYHPFETYSTFKINKFFDLFKLSMFVLQPFSNMLRLLYGGMAKTNSINSYLSNIILFCPREQYHIILRTLAYITMPYSTTLPLNPSFSQVSQIILSPFHIVYFHNYSAAIGFQGFYSSSK